MNFKNKQVEELIQYLQGSCETLGEGVIAVFGEDYSEDDLSLQNVEQIDEEIFLCSGCGWWFEICERSEEQDENFCIECDN